MINAVSDAKALDFFLDNKLYLQNVKYLENSGYSKEDSQSQAFQVSISGTGTTLVDTTVSFSDNRDATLLVAGRKNDASFIKLNDDNDPASDHIAKVRFVHASVEYNRIDMYIVNPKQSISELAPAFENVSYKRVSNYILLDSGKYTVIITEVGKKIPLATLPSSTLSGGGVYTIIATDTIGGIKPARLVFLTDRN